MTEKVAQSAEEQMTQGQVRDVREKERKNGRMRQANKNVGLRMLTGLEYKEGGKASGPR